MTRGRWRRPLVALVAAGLLLGACDRGGGASGEVSLSAPRFPDDQGVATKITNQEIELDGSRRHRVSEDIRSFSTYEPARIEPMANREGQYVQLGLRDRRVVWMAGFAAVVPGEPPTTYFVGRFDRMEKGKAVFIGGTVLTLADGVQPPTTKLMVIAKIDVRTHRVYGFQGN